MNESGADPVIFKKERVPTKDKKGVNHMSPFKSQNRDRFQAPEPSWIRHCK